MEDIQKYVIGIIASAIVSTIAVNIPFSKGSHAALIRLLAGILMAVTVVAPVAELHIGEAALYIDSLMEGADAFSAEGKNIADAAASEIIKQRSEAYVLDKAVQLGVDAQIEVILAESVPAVPYEIRVRGAVSPYAREQLSRIIETDLGIPEDKQFWN